MTREVKPAGIERIAPKRRSFRSRLTLAAVDAFPLRASGGSSPDMALGVMPSRPALLLRLADSDGVAGWGEVWANFPPRANVHKAHLIEDALAQHLPGLSFVEPAEAVQALRDRLSAYFLHVGQLRVFEHVLAGLDIALWDLALRREGRSFAAHMGLPEASAPCYASSINSRDLERLLPLHAQLGQTSFKLKIGSDDDADLAFARRAAQLRPKGCRLMIDSNQSWDLSRAKAMLATLEDVEPAFAEEPIRADSPPDAWEELARATRIPLAGGENVYGIDDFLTMANAGMRILQPDVAKWGGVTGALALAEALPECAQLWPHFMGSAVGQMAALSVAAAIGNCGACEMDVNDNVLRTGLCGDVLTISNGRVTLPGDAGLVPPPLPDFLEEYREKGF